MSSYWGQWPQFSMTASCAFGISEAMRLASSTGPEGSLVVHSTSAGAAMARRSSSVSMLRLRVSGSCSAMLASHALSQSGCWKMACRVLIRSSVTMVGSAISHSSRALTRSQDGSFAASIDSV